VGTVSIAYPASFRTDEHTHIEPVRYGRGSNLLAFMGAILVDGDQGTPRWRAGLREMWRRRRDLWWLHRPRRWSEQTIVVLAMQSLDNSITTSLRRTRLGRRVLTSRQGEGPPNPTWIPAAHEVTRRLAERIGGVACGSVGDLVNVPLTAHFIGGCPIGTSPETGVVDPYHRVFGNPGLHVIDGSTVSVNLGVNPSLTITALAERALAMWPNRGEPDQRPPLGAGYRQVAPVPPQHPVVPRGAPGALRLPQVL
jgi:cholesterol oxidase